MQIGERIPSYTEYAKTPGTDYLEFAAFGDAGTGEIGQQQVAEELRLYKTDPDNNLSFIITTGDNFYPEGVESVTDPLWETRFEDVYSASDLDIPFYAILGNHDYEGNEAAQWAYTSPNNDRWKMPARYYTLSEELPDGTLIDFFFLDTNRILEGDGDQLVWLNVSLKNSLADWKIVIGHHPIYSNGQHGSSGKLIYYLQPILANEADLYLCGHEHDQQILESESGVFFIVNGTGGFTRDVYIGNNTIFAVSRLGFMAFLISRNQMIVRSIEPDNGVIYSMILKEKN